MKERYHAECKEHGAFRADEPDAPCPEEAFDNAVAEGQSLGCTVMEVIDASVFMEDMGDR